MTYPSELGARINLIKHMLTSLETPNEELTKWEENFIESVSEQFGKKNNLSDRQIEILDKIYAEKTS